MYKNLVKFFSGITVSFFTAICGIAISGVLFGKEVMSVSSFYVQGGISFYAVFQVMALAALLAVCNIVLDHPRVLSNMRLTYKIVLRIAISIALILPFIYVCRWFPVDNHEAWLGFVVCFLTCFTVATSLSIYATRKKDREYQKLLDAYKAKKERTK